MMQFCIYHWLKVLIRIFVLNEAITVKKNRKSFHCVKIKEKQVLSHNFYP